MTITVRFNWKALRAKPYEPLPRAPDIPIVLFRTNRENMNLLLQWNELPHMSCDAKAGFALKGFRFKSCGEV